MMVRKLKYIAMAAVTPVVLCAAFCFQYGVLMTLAGIIGAVVLITCLVCTCYGLYKLIEGE